MKISLKAADPALVKSPALIVFLYQDDKPALGGRPELASLKELIAPRLRKKDFQAKHLSVMTLFLERKLCSTTINMIVPERVILVGLGEQKKCDLQKLRQAAAVGAKAARDLSLLSAAMVVPPAGDALGSSEEVVENLVLGVRLGMYQFIDHKTKDEDIKRPLQYLTLVLPQDQKFTGLPKVVDRARIIAQAVSSARDLVNQPANRIYPESLAQEAKRLAEEAGLGITVMDMAAARRKGMGAFLGVAQGSERPGRVIILEYKGTRANAKPVALVGKAITFDSGGLCLKPADGMGNMKTDMAGGAAVLMTLGAAAEMKLKVNLVGIIPAAENMPSGKAYRPGDVLKSLSGQTVEVINTDAEGRLVLADALALALEYKPRAIVDLATLTGACVVALGEKCAGLMGNDEALIEAAKNAARAAGERVWQLPLFEDYFEGLKSEVADFKHTGGRFGGTITAALFLQRFVDETPWVHLDIAGPARAAKASPDTPEGGTGFGVHLLLKLLADLK